jgi:ribosomal protein L37E
MQEAVGICVYHQPLIYGLVYKLYLGRKNLARSHVDCRCYFKRFNLLWKTCLFSGFIIKRMREHAEATNLMCSMSVHCIVQKH